MFKVLAPAAMAASSTSYKNSGSVRPASSGLNSMSAQSERANATICLVRSTTCSLVILSLCSRWIGDGANVLLGGARQPADGGRLARDAALRHVVTDRLGDLFHGVEIIRRRRREARLDHVHAESRECTRDFELLFARHRRARRLLSVAQRRVEDTDVIGVGLGNWTCHGFTLGG